MKANRTLLVSIAMVLLLPFCLGLSCYECTTNDDLAPDFSATEHKDCKEGDLPGSLLVDCSFYDGIFDPRKSLTNRTAARLDPSLNQIKNITWQCAKFQGKWHGSDLTMKTCDPHAWGDMPRNEVDTCYDYNDDGFVGRMCNCFSDKCNGAGNLVVGISTVVFGIIAYLFR